MHASERASWGSRFGLIMAAAGSAVGLGNLWRFPFITAQEGGGAFLLLYLAATVFIGFTLVLVEMSLGKKTHLDPVGALKTIHPGFAFIGGIGVLAAVVIVPYYSVVGSWIVYYFSQIFSGSSIENYEHHFGSFIASPVQPLFFLFLFIFGSAFIVYRGVEKGIEKYSKIIMPLLFLLLLLLMGRALTLEKAWEGVRYFIYPDFSKVTPQTFLMALGQSFFSLSVGMGIYITYGSYIRPEEDLFKVTYPVPLLDTLVSILAGLTIFPAVFAFGIPMNAGPSLVFITLPKIFAALPFGAFFAGVFFLLLLFAAVTSNISLMEVIVSFMGDQLKVKRHKAITIFASYSFLVGIFISLSMGILGNFKIFGKNLFDLSDYLASNIILPGCGLLTSLAVGWFLGVRKLEVFQNKYALAVFSFLVKYAAPIAVGAVLLNVIGLL
jgi:NSS family neurotransmitter:Na+ symporter